MLLCNLSEIWGAVMKPVRNKGEVPPEINRIRSNY